MEKKKTLNRLNRIRGQIDGIIKMVENDRYCIDVSTQIMAAISALNSANKEIISNHLQSCVIESLNSKDKVEIENKIKEIEMLILKLGK